MANAMKHFDQVEAVFASVTAVWARILLFFVICFVAYATGYSCACSYVMDPGNLAYLPVAWFFDIFLSFTHLFGLVYIPVLVIGFCFLGFTDVPAAHPLTWLFLAQLWNAFIYRGSGSDIRTMVIVSVVVFVPYAVGAIIIWRRRRRERDPRHGGSRRAVLED